MRGLGFVILFYFFLKTLKPNQNILPPGFVLQPQVIRACSAQGTPVGRNSHSKLIRSPEFLRCFPPPFSLSFPLLN